MATSYQRALKKSWTLRELAELHLQGDYTLKIRLKLFLMQRKDGACYFRGPCISLQQFNPQGHFLKAISVEMADLERLVDGLQRTREALADGDWQSALLAIKAKQ